MDFRIDIFPLCNVVHNGHIEFFPSLLSATPFNFTIIAISTEYKHVEESLNNEGKQQLTWRKYSRSMFYASDIDESDVGIVICIPEKDIPWICEILDIRRQKYNRLPLIINIQVLVLYWSTNILISHVSSPIEVTRYNVAHQLFSVAMLAYTIITSPLWPAYTDAFVKSDYKWMRNTREKMYRILCLSVAACIVLLFLSEIIYKLWIGNKVIIPLEMSSIVALYVCVFCWQNLNGTLIVAMGKLKLNVIILVIGMFVHIPFSLFLSQWIGCYGVIVSMLLITLMYAVIYHIQVGKLLNLTAHGIWNK